MLVKLNANIVVLMLVLVVEMPYKKSTPKAGLT